MFGFIDRLEEKRKEHKAEKEATRKANLAEFHARLDREIKEFEESISKYDPRIGVIRCDDDDDVREDQRNYVSNTKKEETNINKIEKTIEGKVYSNIPVYDDLNKISQNISDIVEKVPNIDSGKTSISKEDSTYKLTIVTKDGKENSFLVDDGTLMGGTMINILLNLKNDDFFIPVEEGYEDILIKGLSGNLITEKDVKRVRKNFFPNLALYGAFDFSNTTKIDEIKKSGDDFNKLNNVLTTIYMNNLTKANNVPADMPRMRFTYLKNYNDLEVVSDDKVKPGLSSEYNKTMLKIIPGEKYIVNERGIFHYKDGVCLESTPLNVAPANTEAPVIMNNPQPQYYAMQNPYFQMPVAM